MLEPVTTTTLPCMLMGDVQSGEGALAFLALAPSEAPDPRYRSPLDVPSHPAGGPMADASGPRRST